MGYRRVSPGYLWIVDLAQKISKLAANEIRIWPEPHKKGLGDQLQRSVDSIGLNISEGYARGHTKEQIYFFSMAKGSLEEALFAVRAARDRGLIGRINASILSELLMKLSGSLLKFVDSFLK